MRQNTVPAKCVILLAVVAAVTAGAKEDEPEPDLEEIVPARAALCFVGIPGRVGHTGGRVCRTGVRLLAAHDHCPLFPNAAERKLRVRYPSICEGDKVRILDGVYAVGKLHFSSGSFPVFERLSESELPAGVRPLPSTYAFPLGGGGSLHGVRLDIPDKCTKDEAGAVAVTVHLSLLPEDVPARLQKQTVTAGDILWLGHQGHQVRQIVPSNPDGRLIGWIEIDQDVPQK